MQKTSFFYILLCCFGLLLFGCSEGEDLPALVPEEKPIPDPEQTYVDGFNFDLKQPDADQALTITFKAPSSSSLFGYIGDVYLYSGIGSTWIGAPASWTDNQPRFKMEAVSGQANTWSIDIPNSLRAFYGLSASTPVQYLNLIVRSADGSRQTPDYTTLVWDKQIGFNLREVQEKSCPIQGENPEGIHRSATGEITLVCYDADLNGIRKSNAYVMGNFSNWQLDDQYQMNYDPVLKCWWLTLDPLLGTDIAFQYVFLDESDGLLFICDPYSEQVFEKEVDADFPLQAYGRYVSKVSNKADDYVWKINDYKIENRGKLVVYEMLLRDFTTERNLQGAKARLPYLKELGVNAIELMPIQEFDGSSSWGYNTNYYFAIDKSYGAASDLKTFVDACHELDIAVLLDVVYNHTTAQNPFSQLYRDVYKNRPSASNPWLNQTTPHQKYVFSTEDFNHQSSLTQRFVERNLRYFLENYRIDGFRFDFTKGFTQRKSYADADLSAYDPARLAVLKDYIQMVESARPGALVIMEHFCESEESELAASGAVLWRNMNHAYAQAAMGWTDQSDFSALYEASHPTNYIGYMESHDEERLAYKQQQWGNGILQTDLSVGMRQLATNAAFCLLVPGPKMIWQFGELGYDYSINSDYSGQFVDEEFRTAPKPIRWDYLQQSSRQSVYQMYKTCLALRNQYPNLFDGTADIQWQVKSSDWNRGRIIHLKAMSGEELVVIGNYTDNEISASFPAKTGRWKNALTGVEEEIGASVLIPAHDCRIWVIN